MGAKKNYIWNSATCSCENGKYLASIIDDSVITCDEVREETKVKLYKKNFKIFLTFLLITIALLIAVSIYCYLIKYKAKQHLLPFYIPNKELKKVLYE